MLAYMEDRFGIPERLFNDYLLLKQEKAWWLLKKSRNISDAATLKVSLTGLRAFSQVGRFIKPSTRFIQLFGKEAKRATVEISTEELSLLLKGQALSKALDMEKGYVILCLERDFVLGLGFWDGHELRSQLPKKLFTQSYFHDL